MTAPKLTMRVVYATTMGEGWTVGAVMGEVIETVGLRASDFEDAVEGLGGAKAIATMMSAAPDLLEALEGLYNAITDTRTTMEDLGYAEEAASAAIAKAKP